MNKSGLQNNKNVFIIPIRVLEDNYQFIANSKLYY